MPKFFSVNDSVLKSFRLSRFYIVQLLIGLQPLIGLEILIDYDFI